MGCKAHISRHHSHLALSFQQPFHATMLIGTTKHWEHLSAQVEVQYVQRKQQLGKAVTMWSATGKQWRSLSAISNAIRRPLYVRSLQYEPGWEIENILGGTATRLYVIIVDKAQTSPVVVNDGGSRNLFSFKFLILRLVIDCSYGMQ